MREPEKKFRTHISEPRWQQVASVVIVLALAGLWLWTALRR
jgi:ABC-type nickel/cobalt efflux system permease component RcnA